MTAPMKLLRSLLFLSAGNPSQQDIDLRKVGAELRSGRDRVRAARAQMNKSDHLKQLFGEVLEKLK